MKKNMLARFISALFSISLMFSLFSVQAFAEQKVIWQDAIDGVYDTNIPGMILQYKDELAYGGMDLYTGKMANSKTSTDIAYYSGSIAARDIVDLGETDFDKVDTIPEKGFSQELKALPGHVYIVSTHKGEFAKILLKRVMASSVSIKYAIFKENPDDKIQKESDTDAPDENNPGKVNDDSKATTAKKQINITMQIGSPKVKLNGTEKKLDGSPVLSKNKLLIPANYLNPLLGAKFTWDAKTKKAAIHYQNTNVVLQLNSSTALVNQKKVGMDAPFQTINGKLMLPVNLLNSAFKLKVDYAAPTKTIAITGEEQQKDTIPKSSDNTAPNGADKTTTDTKNSAASELDYAFKTFILWVPGAAYSIPDYSSGTNTLYVSSGTLPKSTLAVNKDGTYVWNSAYDSKIINGTWNKNSEGSIDLIKGQEGKTWTLVKSKDGKYEDIFIMDGSTWYSGKAVTVKGK